MAINNEGMDLQITHIAGELKALRSLNHTRSAKDSLNYMHISFSLPHNGNLKVMEEIIVGNLLNSYIMPGLEGDFYFVEFYDQTYLVGLKTQSCHVIDRETHKAILIKRDKKYQLLARNNDTSFTLLRFITVVKYGLVVFFLFPPAIIIVAPMWLLIGICFDKILKRIIKNNQNLLQIFDEIERSQNLFSQEMKRIME